MVPFLDNLSSLKTFQDLYPDGKNLLLSEDTLLVTNIKQQISRLINLELLQSYLKEKMESKPKWKSINMKAKEALEWECIIPTKVSNNSHIAVCSMLSEENILYI